MIAEEPPKIEAGLKLGQAPLNFETVMQNHVQNQLIKNCQKETRTNTVGTVIKLLAVLPVKLACIPRSRESSRILAVQFCRTPPK